MRFIIKVSQPDPQEWRIDVECAAEPPKALAGRTIRRSGTAPKIFPRPAVAELFGLPPDEAFYELCAAPDVEPIRAMLDRIINKMPNAEEVKIFGQYLFETLIGQEIWKLIKDEALDELIEIELWWDESEIELSRLPWEAMHDGSGFISARRVSLTRIVAAAAQFAGKIVLPPRLLVIIGTDVNDAQIRPGAEFLGLLKRVESQEGVKLCARFIQRATRQQIQDEITAYQPSIVHFICHGGSDAGGGFLEIRADDDTTKTERLRGSHLIELLKFKTGAPPLVVLNACDSGKQNPTVNSPPLAVELVEGGTPIVVGMGGRVADAACRLFTRRFYEAILKGEPLAAAAAQGRRAGIIHLQKNAEDAIDWAFPTLFAAPGALSQVAIDHGWLARQIELESFAKSFSWGLPPPLFCSNYAIFEDFHKLLRAENKLTVAQVMAITVNCWESKINKPQYGKSRLLHELAVQAAREGHLPCLVTFHETDLLPVDAVQIGWRIVRAVRDSRKNFNLAAGGSEFLKLRDFYDGKTTEGALHSEVRNALQFPLPRGEVVRAALQIDLLALLTEARAKSGMKDLKVVVLIDEAHRFDAGAQELVNEMLDRNGLGNNADPIPVVIAFSTRAPANKDWELIAEGLQNSLMKRKIAEFYTLAPLRPPSEEWLAYHQFVLSQNLALTAELEKRADKFYESIYAEMCGVPSALNGDGVEVVLRSMKNMDWLVPSTDEKLLKDSL